ncbi:MAG: formylmethanofuran--tetrahydromethanopterin N-formyltransferase, partial [Gemmataceae bacterium]
MSAIIDDTYAEAFRSIYAEVLVTAVNRRWLDHAVAAATGNASSSILCDCEAGLSRYAADTPDGRPGAVLQFHVPRFWKEREAKLERALLVRVSQNVLTCPTTACFNVLPADPNWFPLGRKVAYFGDGHQFKDERFGRRVRVIPILSGEFVIERRFGWADGLMGGNLWFFGATADGALTAAERAVEGAMTVSGVSLPFPGGVAGSGSKAGSKYKFAIASTYAEYCPTLKGKPGVESRLPDGVVSVQEVIINGPDLKTLAAATQAAIAAAKDTPDL